MQPKNRRHCTQSGFADQQLSPLRCGADCQQQCVVDGLWSVFDQLGCGGRTLHAGTTTRSELQRCRREMTSAWTRTKTVIVKAVKIMKRQAEVWEEDGKSIEIASWAQETKISGCNNLIAEAILLLKRVQSIKLLFMLNWSQPISATMQPDQLKFTISTMDSGCTASLSQSSDTEDTLSQLQMF